MKFLNSYIIVFVIFIGILLAILKFRPKVLLFLTGFMVPFGISRDIIGTFTVYTSEIIILVSAIAWIVYGIRNKKFISYFKELKLWFLFFFVLFISLFRAISFYEGVKEIIRWGEVFFVYLFLIEFLDKNKVKHIFTFFLLIIIK